eukprot:244495-Amphidinium_carterae.3
MKAAVQTHCRARQTAEKSSGSITRRNWQQHARPCMNKRLLDSKCSMLWRRRAQVLAICRVNWKK